MLGRIKKPGVDFCLSAIRQMKNHLELGFARPQWKDKRIPVPVLLRNWRGIQGLPAFCLSDRFVHFRSLGKVELEIMIVHLRHGRIRGIVHGKNPYSLQFVSLRLKPEHISGDADSGDLFGHVVNLNVN